MPFSTKFAVDQNVEVARRTETGSNKPGGAGKITKVEISRDGNELYEVQYLHSRSIESNLPASIIKERVLSESRPKRNSTESGMLLGSVIIPFLTNQLTQINQPTCSGRNGERYAETTA
jgi:hypothetical protein